MTALQVGRQTSRWNLETQKRGKGGPPTGMEGLTQGRNLNLAVWLSPPRNREKGGVLSSGPNPLVNNTRNGKSTSHRCPRLLAQHQACGPAPSCTAMALAKGWEGGLQIQLCT